MNEPSCFKAYYIRGNAPQQLNTTDRTDGLSIEFADWRINLRASNTEPLLCLDIETLANPVVRQQKVVETTQLIQVGEQS